MALVFCPDCAGMVSDRAEACPQCGRPAPKPPACPFCHSAAAVSHVVTLCGVSAYVCEACRRAYRPEHRFFV